jgi:hypothetical protein
MLSWEIANTLFSVPKRTQYVLAQEIVSTLDMELPYTKHILAQYRGLCLQCLVVLVGTGL